MKVVVCRELGDPSVLRIEERPAPTPGPSQVLVALKAAGVNYSDMLTVRGGYQFKPPLPFIPGTEAAGDIVALGSEVESFAVGDKVLVKARFGLFAEQVAVPAANLRPLPKPFDYETGAVFSSAYMTAYHALIDRGRLQAGESVVVHGASGGVGMAAVEMAKVHGARVIATGASAQKLAAVTAFGADHVIDLSAGDLRDAVMALTGGRGADLVFDPVGGDVLRQSLRAMAWGGRLLVIGFVAEDIADVPANYPLLKGCSVIGVRAGEFARRDPAAGAHSLAALTALADAVRLHPQISHRLPLERAAEALQLFLDRKIIGKAVLTIA